LPNYNTAVHHDRVFHRPLSFWGSQEGSQTHSFTAMSYYLHKIRQLLINVRLSLSQKVIWNFLAGWTQREAAQKSN